MTSSTGPSPQSRISSTAVGSDGLPFVPLHKCIKMAESSRYSENLTRKCQSLPPTLFWIRNVMMHFEGREFPCTLDLLHTKLHPHREQKLN